MADRSPGDCRPDRLSLPPPAGRACRLGPAGPDAAPIAAGGPGRSSAGPSRTGRCRPGGGGCVGGGGILHQVGSFYTLALLSAVVFGFLGALVGRSKGRVGTGALLGFLLGIFGLIIVALLPSRRYAMPPVAAPRQYQPVPPPVPVPAQWAPDPSGRHELRWWDGRGWSEHVADGGNRGIDPLSPAG